LRKRTSRKNGKKRMKVFRKEHQKMAEVRKEKFQSKTKFEEGRCPGRLHPQHGSSSDTSWWRTRPAPGVTQY
jgi:hypothetical protein